MENKKIIVSGKRKSAIAKAKLTNGKGNIFFNGLSYEKLILFHRLALSEPIKIAEKILGKLNFDIEIKTSGGGKEAQIQAGRLAIAKGILKFTGSEELRVAYMKYDRHLLVADVRRKEAYKPDDSKARAKRQTSYR